MKKLLQQGLLGLLVFMALNAPIAVFYEYQASKAKKNKTHRKYLRWTDIHENKNTYDLIVIGTSRAYDSYNPTIIDSTLNIQSYNMGSAAQDIVESYYVLEEIFEYQKPKYIVFDLFFDASDDMYEYHQTFSNLSFFNSNKRKFKLITSGYGLTGIVNYSIPLIRYNTHIKQDIGNIFNTNKNQKKEDKLIKGYLYNTVTITNEEISKLKPIPYFENTNFNANRFTKYFNKIKTLTEKNNATLICVRSPYPPSRIALSKIDDEGDYFNAFMKNINVSYYDLNYFKSNTYQYLDKDFADYHHSNYRGAKKSTMQLIDAIKENKL